MSKRKTSKATKVVVDNSQLLFAVKIVKISNDMLGVIFVSFEYEVGFSIVGGEFINNTLRMNTALKGTLIGNKEKGVEIGDDNTDLTLTMINYIKQVIDAYNIDDDFMKAEVDRAKLSKQIIAVERLAQELTIDSKIMIDKQDYATYVTKPFQEIGVTAYVLLDIEYNPQLTNLFCIIDRFVTITVTDAIKTKAALDTSNQISIVPAMALFPRSWLPLITYYKSNHVGGAI